ncbi:MAG: HD domain-containing protein [Candidatus Omnitrophica bacterium]|nr:HD domain-containing protein [Candidatus Omnitrophota bacterium]
MVELHRESESFGDHSLSEKRRQDKGLLLSGGTEEVNLTGPEPGMAEAEVFYGKILGCVRSVFDRVGEGKEDRIKAEDIVGPLEEFYGYFDMFRDSNDLMRLVFQHDEYRENYIYTHSVNVCFLSVRMALELNFSKSKLLDVMAVSLFHDIGMMKVPMDMWNTDRKLSPFEYREVQRHPVYGEEILGNISGIADTALQAVGQHQEKTDGTGYPGGLTKDSINYLARMVSLVDRYEALTHSRLWRPPFLPDKAIQQILDNESGSYDPHFMKAMLRYISVFPVATWVKISSGEIGVIVRINEDTPMRPVVNVIFGRDGNRLPGARSLDLSKQLLIHVDKCISREDLPGQA